MKWLTTLLLCSITIITPKITFAKLGLTVEESDKFYGSCGSIDEQADGEWRQYKKGTLCVASFFSKNSIGTSVVLYKKSYGSLDEKTIASLLCLNWGGATWTKTDADKGTRGWVSSDKRAIALYTENDHTLAIKFTDQTNKSCNNQCSKCNKDNPSTAKFCMGCGAKIGADKKKAEQPAIKVAEPRTYYYELDEKRVKRYENNQMAANEKRAFLFEKRINYDYTHDVKYGNGKSLEYGMNKTYTIPSPTELTSDQAMLQRKYRRGDMSPKDMDAYEAKIKKSQNNFRKNINDETQVARLRWRNGNPAGAMVEDAQADAARAKQDADAARQKAWWAEEEAARARAQAEAALREAEQARFEAQQRLQDAHMQGF